MGIYQERADKDTAAYLAFVDALDGERPLGGGEDEFLDLHRFVAGLDTGVLTAVWTDPYAHFWIRLAFELCRSALRGEPLPRAGAAYGRELGTRDVRSALREHLEQFKRLALGAALRAGEKLELTAPLDVALPTALPGTGAALVGTGRARIAAVVDGEVRCSGGAAQVERCPLARYDDIEVPLQPHGYAVPGMGWMPPAGRTDLTYQASQRRLVEDGLALVAECEAGSFAQLRSVLRWIAVNPPWEHVGTNFVSYSELPGAFAVRGIPNPLVVGEPIVHEYHHNRLFCLEDLEPVLEGDALGTDDEALYYSPWRQDLRPVRGILHAVYVTIPQTRYWLGAYRSGATRAPERAVMLDAMARAVPSLVLGIDLLERFGRFTPLGEVYLRQLRADVDQLDAEIRAAGVPKDCPAARIDRAGRVVPGTSEVGTPSPTALRILAEHALLYDTGKQAPDWWLKSLEANAL